MQGAALSPPRKRGSSPRSLDARLRGHDEIPKKGVLSTLVGGAPYKKEKVICRNDFTNIRPLRRGSNVDRFRLAAVHVNILSSDPPAFVRGQEDHHRRNITRRIAYSPQRVVGHHILDPL